MSNFGLSPETETVGLGSIGLLLLGSTLAAILAVLVVELFHGSRFASVIAALLAGDLWYLARYAWLSPYRGWADLRQRFAPIGYRVVLGSAVGGAALVFAFIGFEQVLELSGINLAKPPSPTFVLSQPSQLPVAVLTIVIIGPLAEELLFRGLLLDWLRRRMRTWTAVAVVSVLFSLAHGIAIKSGLAGWLQCAYRILMGLITALLTVRFYSLLPSFAFHATVNCISVVGMLIQSH